MLDEALQLRYHQAFVGFNPHTFGYVYDDRLKNPRAYLNAVGIEKICEFVMNGGSPRQIARVLLVSQVTLRRWIEADDERAKAWEWAISAEADNQMYEAREIVDNVHVDTESISKAAKQAEHRRHMAKGMGAARWGNKVNIDQTLNVGVTYTFDVALKPEQKALEGTAVQVKQIPSTGVDLSVLGDLNVEEAGAQEAADAQAA